VDLLIIKFQIDRWFKGPKVIACTRAHTHKHIMCSGNFKVIWNHFYRQSHFLWSIFYFWNILFHDTVREFNRGCFIICQFFEVKLQISVYYLHMFISFLTAEKLEVEHGIPGLCLLSNRQVLNRTRPVLFEVIFTLFSCNYLSKKKLVLSYFKLFYIFAGWNCLWQGDIALLVRMLFCSPGSWGLFSPSTNTQLLLYYRWRKWKNWERVITSLVSPRWFLRSDFSRFKCICNVTWFT
jgi:hypothetical protein